MQRKGFSIAAKKILYTVGVIFTYTAIYNLSYPGCIDVMQSQGNIKSYVTDINITSVLSQATRPYIFANVIMNMLTLISDYFDKLKSNADSKNLYDIINIGVMLFFSIAHSIMNISYIDPHVTQIFKPSFFIYYSIINLVSCLFVAWFNRQLVLNGIGYGVTLIISLQIINGFIKQNCINTILDIFTKIGMKQFLYLWIMFFMLVVIEKYVVRIPLMALNTYGNECIEDASKGYIEYKPTNTNVIANVLALQTISLLMLFIGWLFGDSIINFINSYRIANWISNIGFYYDKSGNYVNYASLFMQYFLYLLLLLSYNYIYNTVYHSPHKTAESMRKQICYIPFVGIGKKTESLIDNVAMLCSIFAVLITIYIMSLPIIIGYFIGSNTLIGGIDLMIISSSFVYLIEFAKSMHKYSTYSFSASALSKIKK